MLIDALIWLFMAIVYPDPIGQCQEVGGPLLEFTAAERAEVKRRNKDAARDMGHAPIVVAFLDAWAERESSYNPSVRHTLGKGERGLGLHGLGRIHAAKYPGPWEDMCTPEASLQVASEIVQIAVRKYRAANAWDIQAIVAGRFECVRPDLGTCTQEQQDRTSAAICGRMEARGFSCFAPITTKDLGPRVPKADRARMARESMQ